MLIAIDSKQAGRLIAIDSGKNMGWAIFDAGKLISCGFKTLPDQLPAAGITRVVIERPHAGKTRAKAKDILTLAVRAGEAGGLLRYLTKAEPEYIEPGRWKGQLPKKRCNEIVLGKLTPEEKTLVTVIKPKGQQHNVIDAIGIGLYTVGRWIV